MAAGLEPAHMPKRHGEADRAVATHAKISDVVEENDAGGARRIVGLAQERPDDCIMPVRLVDGEAAEVVELAGKASAALSERTVAQRRTAVDDHARRLALGMGVDNPHEVSPSRPTTRPTRLG